MFNKYKKNSSSVEEEIIVATSKSEYNNKKMRRREIKTIKDINIINKPEKNTTDYRVGNFSFYDSDPQDECTVKDSDIKETKDFYRSETKRKDLSSFFEESKKYNRMIQEKEASEKNNFKRQKVIKSEPSSVNNDYAYVFRNIQYTEVKDFIDYLDIHYLDIENISKEALSDEKFYEWLSKKSNVFDDSIKQFKEIKDKIEKK